MGLAFHEARRRKEAAEIKAKAEAAKAKAEEKPATKKLSLKNDKQS